MADTAFTDFSDATSLAGTDIGLLQRGSGGLNFTFDMLAYKQGAGIYYAGGASGNLTLRLESTSASGVGVSVQFKTSNRAWDLGQGTGVGDNSFTVFDTTASALRFRIDTSGHILPGADNAQNLGSGSVRYATIYAGTGTINTSDEREKQQTGEITDELLDAWAAVEWRRFKYNAAVEAKGDDARWHFGAVAQQVRDAIDGALGEGEAIRLGLCCYDSWDAIEAIEEERDGDGNVIAAAQPGREAGDLWGLRYDECFAIEAAYQRRRMAAIEARLAALEA